MQKGKTVLGTCGGDGEEYCLFAPFPRPLALGVDLVFPSRFVIFYYYYFYEELFTCTFLTQTIYSRGQIHVVSKRKNPVRGYKIRYNTRLEYKDTGSKNNSEADLPRFRRYGSLSSLSDLLRDLTGTKTLL